jgi:large subunit ribosomal protein L10Ae
MKICVLGDELHCDEAKQAGLDFQTTEDLGKFKKDKKMVKKLGTFPFCVVVSVSISRG